MREVAQRHDGRAFVDLAYTGGRARGHRAPRELTGPEVRTQCLRAFVVVRKSLVMPATRLHRTFVEIEHARPLPATTVPDHSQTSGIFAAIVATSADAIICVDEAQRIVEFNLGAERIFLRARADVLGLPLELLIPDSFRSAHAKQVEHYAADGEPRRMARDRPATRGVRSNGEEFAAEATIARHELEGQRLLSVIVRDLTEQSRVDAEAERCWRELFEAASEGIFIADQAGHYTDVNRAACALLGYRRDELIDMTIVDLIPADQAERFTESKQQLDAGGIHVAEWSLRCKDGAYVPVEVSAKMLPDGRWTAFVRDIRDRKAAEEAWRIEQQRLRVALTGSPVSAFAQDLELRYTWSFNPPAPLTPAEVIGRTAEDFAQPALTQRLLDVKRRVIATGVPARELLCNVIGGRERYFDTSYEPLRDPTGRIVGITGASWDVTDRKRAEDEQHLFARVSAVLGATMLDWTDLLAGVAPLALGMLADFCVTDLLDENELVQRRDVVHVDPERAALCAALRNVEIDRGRPHLAFEAIRTRRPLLVDHVSPHYLASVAQSERHLELLSALGLRSVIAVPLISRGRLLGAYVLGSSRRDYEPDDLRIATELSERVALALDNARLHRDLERALQSRADVLAIVAHDLRNPLNSILLQSELLSSTLRESLSGKKALERIRASAHRMNRLVQDLLDVVRLRAGEPLAIELGEVVPGRVAEEILDSLRPQAEISLLELRLECDADLSHIRGDHDRLVQVLDNLVGNAIKFSPRGACVIIGLHQRDGEVEFSVTDTGRGIAPDQIEHLFDRFWQADRTDRRGSGLGLSVVKGIVDAHRGRIWVDTQVGRGSTFYFTIPTCSTS